ncbi:MAG: tRNA (guanosine(46)-N7)-methyltransferase TrmB [Gammaproteobacteria bacterium]|nr:MAG: tRNA (guanosine(46)-N7)-methyltransferase TrmB [Gammaproteobacteria bacterium]
MNAALPEDTKHHRPIRSYVRRSGRLTEGQARALELLWPRFGIEPDDNVLDYQQLFARNAPTFVEIGFGMGQSLAEMARQRPEHNFIGIEVHRPGVGSLLCQIKEFDLGNVRVISADAVGIMTVAIPLHSLDGVYLFFPDPWHKKRHHKRRIVQTSFVDMIVQRIKPGGIFHMATDWEDYAEHMLQVGEACDGLLNAVGKGNFMPDTGNRVETKFERRGLRLGHGIWDLVFVRND